MSPLLITIIGSTLAVIVGIILRKIATIKLVTNRSFRGMQVEQRRLHDEHFVLKCDFDELKSEYKKCHKELEDRIIGREAFYREFDRLEKTHNDDVAELYKQIKGGFESITIRIDNLKDK